MNIDQLLETHRKVLAIADHGSYHAYLSRRILSLRRKLGIATPKSQKFTPREVTQEDVAKDVRQIELLLLQAERAWARAMQLKSLKGEAEGGLKGRDRSEVISKSVKAARLASKIATLVEQSESQDIIASRAYAAMLKGTATFEKLASASERRPKEQWEACLTQWSTARILYAISAEQGTEISSDLIANTIDPTLRYAAYQAGIQRTVSMLDVSRRYFTKDQDVKRRAEELDPYALTGRPRAYGEKTAKGETPQTIAWRGRSAEIVDASIGQALGGVYAAEAKLRSFLDENLSIAARDRAAAYDEVLVASQDAVDAAKRAADELEKEKIEESNPRMQNLRITSLATTYNLISWRVGRNRVLVGSKDGLLMPTQSTRRGKTEQNESIGRKLALLKERIVLLDAILQSIESIKDLRGAMRDESFVQELEGKLAYFRAMKCVSISYSQLLCNEPLNSLALLKRADDLISQAKLEGPAAVKPGPLTLELDQATVDEARSTVARLQAQSHAKATLRQFESNSAIAAAKHLTSAEPWINKLDDYPTPGLQVDLTRIVSYPPKLEPVPVKPIFLDIAWNYIDYPGHRETVSPAVNGVSQSEAGTEEKKRGWFGFGR